jgi:uncharacterized protein YjbI with pentapeptide repeats
MATPKHVDLVQQGAEAIRQWREKNPDVRLDLYTVNLGEATLVRADLHGATLGGADLGGAYLYRATLGGPYLYGARGTHQAHGLESVRFTPTATPTRAVPS